MIPGNVSILSRDAGVRDDAGLDTTSTLVSARTSAAIPILYIDHTALLGGGEIALLNLVRKLDRERYVPIVVLLADGPLRQRLQEAGIRVILLKASPNVLNARKDAIGTFSWSRLKQIYLSLCTVVRLDLTIRSIGAPLVHTNSLKADIIGGLAARLAGKRVVWHVRDRIADDYLPSNVAKLFRVLCRVIPHRIVTNSAATLRTLGDSNSIQATVVYSGLDSNGRSLVIHDGTPSRPVIEKKASAAPLLGLVGRLSPWKGQHIFIEAAHQVLQRFPDARFQIIGSALFGEDAYERQLREQVARLGIEHAVEFTGFCANVLQRIEPLSILVHASTTGEPFGQVVIEGMAGGKPVVATNGGGIPEIVVDGETGLLVPMGDAHAMAAAMERLLDQPELAQSMGERGRARVEEQFLIDHTVNKVMELYDDMLGVRHS